MKRALSLLLAPCLLLGMLSGCGRKAGTPSTPGDPSFGAETSVVEAETSQQEQVERTSASFAMPYNAAYGWDPFNCVGMENRAVMELMYESLFCLDNQFQPEPVLCKSYTVSEDGTTYTLELQENVSFSSGKTLYAEDVVYSMGKAMESPIYGGRFNDVSVYYADGLNTVIIELITPNDRLPCLLDFPIVPSYGGTEEPAGTGPFVRAGDSLAVNPQWWQDKDRLQFQTVTLYSSASAEDTRDNFEIDTIHFVYNNPSASTAATFHCDYELWNSRSAVMQYVGFNLEGFSIFADGTLRAALTHAIDRNSIAESVYHNFADAASLPAPPSYALYDADLAQKYAFTSVKNATEELKQSESFSLPDNYTPNGATPQTILGTGIPDEDEEEEEEPLPSPEPEETGSPKTTYNPITMLVMSGNLRRVAAAKQVGQQLTDVGFTVTIKELEQDEFIYTLNSGEWDLYYGEVTLQPDFDLRPLLASGGSLAYGNFSGSATAESLMEKSKENSGNYYDLYEFVMDHGLLCPVLFVNNAVFTTRGVFSGLDPTPDNLFHGITRIKVNHD